MSTQRSEYCRSGCPKLEPVHAVKAVMLLVQDKGSPTGVAPSVRSKVHWLSHTHENWIFLHDAMWDSFSPDWNHTLYICIYKYISNICTYIYIYIMFSICIWNQYDRDTIGRSRASRRVYWWQATSKNHPRLGRHQALCGSFLLHSPAGEANIVARDAWYLVSQL